VWDAVLDEAVCGRFDALARRLGAKGCDAHEIRRVEAEQGVALPASYRYFRYVMGRNTGGLLVGSALSIDEVAGIRQLALDLVAESSIEFTRRRMRW
jgi:cell wall assembly regulator SMI1